MLLREPLQNSAGVSHHVAKPFQVKGLGARRHVGSEGLATTVDNGQILRWPTDYRTYHCRSAFVERASTEMSLHSVVVDVGAGSYLRHPLYLRYVFHCRRRAKANIINPKTPLPHPMREGDHETSFLSACLLDL